MPAEHDRSDGPLGIERDHDKRGEALPEEGPPVAQIATTYGSSFVETEEQASAFAEEPSGPIGPPRTVGGNHGVATDSDPVDPAT